MARSGTIGPCSVFGCGRPCETRQYCSLHYRRLRRRGDLDARPRGRPKVNIGLCRIEGCDGIARTDGLCGKHYANQREYGEPVSPTARPMLSRAEVEIIQASRGGDIGELAERFGASRPTIVAIQNGRSWGIRRSYPVLAPIREATHVPEARGPVD